MPRRENVMAQEYRVRCLTSNMARLAQVAAIILLAFVNSPAGHAQTPAPRFEVASVRRCVDLKLRPGISAASPGRLTVNCSTLMNLINQAYVLYANGTLDLLGERLVPVENGSAWMNTDRFTIEAKAEGGRPVPSSGV